MNKSIMKIFLFLAVAFSLVLTGPSAEAQKAFTKDKQTQFLKDKRKKQSGYKKTTKNKSGPWTLKCPLPVKNHKIYIDKYKFIKNKATEQLNWKVGYEANINFGMATEELGGGTYLIPKTQTLACRYQGLKKGVLAGTLTAEIDAKKYTKANTGPFINEKIEFTVAGKKVNITCPKAITNMITPDKNFVYKKNSRKWKLTFQRVATVPKSKITFRAGKITCNYFVYYAAFYQLAGSMFNECKGEWTENAKSFTCTPSSVRE